MFEIKNQDEFYKDTEAIMLAAYIRDKYFKYTNNIDNREISPIKLQKSLYFLFAYWGKFIRNNKNNSDSVEVDYSSYNEYLFDDKIEAWTYGPVIPSVFLAEKCEYLRNVNIDKYLENDHVKKEFVDDLLNQLFEISDFSLVDLSHQDECWKNYYIESDVKHNREIPKEDIINEYCNKSA